MGIFNNFFNMFRVRNEKRNNTASNSELKNMKDTHISFGEDPGSVSDTKDEER